MGRQSGGEEFAHRLGEADEAVQAAQKLFDFDMLVDGVRHADGGGAEDDGGEADFASAGAAVGAVGDDIGVGGDASSLHRLDAQPHEGGVFIHEPGGVKIGDTELKAGIGLEAGLVHLDLPAGEIGEEAAVFGQEALGGFAEEEAAVVGDAAFEGDGGGAGVGERGDEEGFDDGCAEDGVLLLGGLADALEHEGGLIDGVFALFGVGGVGGAATGDEIHAGAAFLADSQPAVGGFADDDAIGFEGGEDAGEGGAFDDFFADGADDMNDAGQLIARDGTKRHDHGGEAAFGIGGAAPPDLAAGDFAAPGGVAPFFGVGDHDGIHVAVVEDGCTGQAAAPGGDDVAEVVAADIVVIEGFAFLFHQAGDQLLFAGKADALH